jgi:hypothetical protein
MSILSKKTAKFLCIKSAISRRELGEEAQKLVELAEDPSVPSDQKQAALRNLDTLIEKLEKKVDTTKRLKSETEKDETARP